MAVLLILAVAVLLLAVCLAAAWSIGDDAPENEATRVPDRADDRAAAPVAVPETLEGALVRQLVAGEITGRQYRNEMARVAARDADRHPLDVPSDGGTADA
jgi:hypothetical protein